MDVADSRRQILLLIPNLQGGGAERVVVTLLRHLDRVRFGLTIAVVDMRGAAFQHDVPEDVELIDLECSRVRFALPKIVRLIWHRRPDLVFSTLGHLNLALAVVRPLLPDRARYVARETVVVSELLRSYARPAFWRWAYRKFYRRFDKVVCQSLDMRDDLVEKFALPMHKAVVIKNPVDVARIRRLAAEPLVTGFEKQSGNEALIYLVAAGRLVSQKGFDLLIEALGVCGNPRLRLTILGEGPQRGELERLVHKQNVSGQVRFAGFQENPYPFFAKADAFVLSSRFEGFPNVVLEALACGTPVIATPAPGGVREILEGVEGGVLAESVTAEGLAKAIRLMSYHKRPSPEVVGPYEVTRIVEQYEREFA